MSIIPLKKLRNQKELTQAELSTVLNVSPSTIGMWEQGRREPDYDYLKAIADYFNVSIDYLLGRKTANSSPPLSDEHSSLLQKYDALADDGRQLIRTMLDSLLLSHPKHLPSDSNLK